jgi:RNA polymerase sigma-70 factor (ECF subfamily)
MAAAAMTQSGMTIADAVRGAQQGDQQAFAEIYRTYRSKVRSLCWNWSRDRELAEDLSQDIFLTVLLKIGQYRGDAAFSTWLFRLSFNCFLMYRRRQKQCTTVSLQDCGGMGEDGDYSAAGFPVSDPQLEGTVNRVALDRAILELPEGMQRTLRMHDLEGLQHHEIALQLGHTTGNSKSQLFKARQKLRKALQPKKRLSQ